MFKVDINSDGDKCVTMNRIPYKESPRRSIDSEVDSEKPKPKFKSLKSIREAKKEYKKLPRTSSQPSRLLKTALRTVKKKKG